MNQSKSSMDFDAMFIKINVYKGILKEFCYELFAKFPQCDCIAYARFDGSLYGVT